MLFTFAPTSTFDFSICRNYKHWLREDWRLNFPSYSNFN